MPRIQHVTTVDPPYAYTTEEVIEAFDRLWLPDLSPALQRKTRMLLGGSQIVRRRSVVPIEVILGRRGFAERNRLYAQAMIELGEKALRRALVESGTKPEDLGAIISTSCTGFMIPSVDAHLVDRLGLPKDIVRLPVTEMGCAGGAAGLIYARDFARARPGKKVALLSLEAPTLTFIHGDHSGENLVSASIFADGVACAIVGEGPGTAILDADMYHFPQSTHLMGYELIDQGFKIVLDRHVPSAIHEHFRGIVLPFLRKNGLLPSEIEHYLVHPGGKKILQMAEEFAAEHGREIDDSRAVLETRGNMSSATVLHILERTLKHARPGELGCMLAFGPGFTAQSLLLRFA